MTTQELAQTFSELLKSGKACEAGRSYWSDDIVSMEALEGDMAVRKGRSGPRSAERGDPCGYASRAGD
jgi:hypothetical protein